MTPATATTATETISERFRGIESWSDGAILAAFSEGQERAIAAVRKAHAAISEAAAAIASRGKSGGRIVYLGAGSSGLFGALDGMELGGTYGWPDDRIAFVLATGDRIAPMTGAEEDDSDLARAGIAALALTPDDVVIAIAASGTTPFTLAGVAEAKATGALVIGIANNAGTPLLQAADVPVFLDSGPETVVGSTRMNAGTAQKAALGLMSSLAMMRLGETYDGLMVNLRVDNAKLRRRAVTTLVHIVGCSAGDAEQALGRAGGSVKRAALILRGVAPEEADQVLEAAAGNLRAALAASA